MVSVCFQFNIFNVFKPGVLAEVFPEVLDEMAFGIYKAGLVLVVFFVFFKNFIQGCRVILLHVQVSLFRNERHPLSKLGLCILLFGKGFPDPLSRWVKLINLPCVTAFSDRHGLPLLFLLGYHFAPDKFENDGIHGDLLTPLDSFPCRLFPCPLQEVFRHS